MGRNGTLRVRSQYSRTPQAAMSWTGTFDGHDLHTASDMADARLSARGSMLADFECPHGSFEEECEDCRK